MSKQRILMIVAMCFVLLGSVAAGRGHRSEPKPDSLVSCTGGPVHVGVGRYVVDNLTVPASFNPIRCFDVQAPDFPPGGAGSTCSACIESLEHQGCEVLDVNLSLADGILFTGRAGDTLPHAVFVLSCERL